PGPGPRSHAGPPRARRRAATAAASRRPRPGASFSAADSGAGPLPPERRRWHFPRGLHCGNRPRRGRPHGGNPVAAAHRRARPAERPAMTPDETATRSPGARWRAQLASCEQRVAARQPLSRQGRVTRATGLVLEATGLQLPVGAACKVQISPDQDRWADAEVVGFHADTLYLMPQSDISGLPPGARIVPAETLLLDPVPLPEDPDAQADTQASIVTDQVRHLPVGDALLGRVLDGAGRPLDGKPLPPDLGMAPLTTLQINPLTRAPVDTVLDVGVRAINGLLTVGRGQRMGLFAGSGVGKSVLLGMMARYTKADVIVVGLIGERGREVKEFIELNLGADGLARSVVVAAPADVSPLLRMQGGVYATRLAEYFRDQGRHVLLIMDSLTRYAMAQREIALAIGEPPATKGYP